MLPSWAGETALLNKRLNSAGPYQAVPGRPHAGNEGSAMDAREGGIERAIRPGGGKPRAVGESEEGAEPPGKVKRSADRVRPHSWDGARKRGRFGSPP